MEFRNGWMVLFMRASGFIIGLKVLAFSGMLREMFIKEISKLIRHVVMEFICMLMEAGMKENGLMMFRKGRAKKLGLMELNILDNIKMA